MAGSFCFLASVLVFVASMSSIATATSRLDLVGDYKPIKDIADPYIQSLGEFAVKEHNKEAKTELKFKEVISGKLQIVAGTNYELQLTALEGSIINIIYETLVFTDLKNENHLIKFYSISN
ncbi:cysteine proteinase inhibitor 5 [Cucumis sativus]|uniref:Cystatin domain-containing protein n=1 Tax=Cucumis sativus TaxID=3659 RepID=A0A0A0LT34_CUCSA|nr:cysteine proteinase inhibitor 5 [Cucumis sativus]